MATYNPKILAMNDGADTYNYSSGPFYAECSTAADTQTKAVTISEIAELNAGLSLRIKFTNAQSYAGQPKLQINSLTATNIVCNGTTAAAQNEWKAGEVVDFVYDGTNFSIVAVTSKPVQDAYDLANGKVSCTTANVKSALGTGAGTDKYLREDGTWQIPPDTKTYVYELGSVTNSSGSYTGTFLNSSVSANMKPIKIEVSDPTAFRAAITVEALDGTLRVLCDNFVGTSTITVTLIRYIDLNNATTFSLSSEEAIELSGMIGSLSALTTSSQASIVDAINSGYAALNNRLSYIGSVSTNSTSYLSTSANQTIILITFATNASSMASMHICNMRPSSNSGVASVKTSSNVTVSGSSNRIQIANASTSYAASLFAVCLNTLPILDRLTLSTS